MIEKGKLKDDFFRRRILGERLVAILLTLLILVIFFIFFRSYILYAIGLFIVLIILDMPGLLNKYQQERRLLNWVDQNKEIVILAYTTKVRYLDLVEKHIVQSCPEEVIIVKINEHRLSGNIRRSIWFELARKIRLRHMPCIIKIQHRSYQVVQLKRYLNDYINHQMDEKTMLETIANIMSQPILDS